MKRWTISVVVAFLAALLLYIPVNNLHIQDNEQRYEDTRMQASHHLNFIRDDIQAQLDSSLYYADFFEMIVSQDPDVTEKELRAYSDFIIERNSLVDSVSLAKDGIIHFVYPLEGNEEALGYNLLEEPDRKRYLEEAIIKRKAVAQGPVEAVQGGMKIFNRKPVFIESDNTEEVWGFASVTIDFDHLVETSLLSNDLPGYKYAIKVESDRSQPVFWGEEGVFESEAVTASISLPENNWTIALIPADGWNRNIYYHSVETLIFYVFILIIFKLVLFFVHQYFTKRELSRIDALTCLLNKKTFEQSVKNVLRYSTKKNGLLLIDFNDFKLINDTHGHLVGDKVLAITAERLLHTLKKTDLIGRIGGDEIMILVKDMESEKELETIKDRVIERIEKPILYNDKIIHPSISVGHTLISHLLPFNHLYEIVDKKMYRDKTTKKVIATSPFEQPELES
ncbi:diguanylate cyclase domain-containing protein [Alkalibacterium sp. f15]|uniref:diguanylate cyclase domain-containing protein n=1 Tax=Alkalibacterium sp. f15 TaxID=3414029 RepID=UPI003BF78EDB